MASNITTKRLTLRGFTLDDADDVTRLVSDYEVAKTTLAVPHPYPTDGAVGWIAGHPAEEERNHTTFAITLTATGELIGAITLIEKRIHLRAEIGYWIGYQHWGNGYATEATKAIIQWGFSGRGLNRIFAHHFVENPASGRVMQKSGMSYEGTIRDCVQKDGRFIDTPMYPPLLLLSNRVITKMSPISHPVPGPAGPGGTGIQRAMGGMTNFTALAPRSSMS
jgi:RimJ/RimL family protein N-acetyltransferase